MYYCMKCGCEFAKADVICETHGLLSPPFEKRQCCPLCGSGDINSETASYCRCCGAKLGTGEKEYCSPSCRKRGEEMRRREIKKKKLIFSSPLFQIVKEVDEYNAKNHTDYSYGQYVTLVKPHLKRGGRK